MSFSEDIVELVERSETGLISRAPLWPRVPLGKLVSVLNGFPFKSSMFNSDSGAPVIRIRDVTSGNTKTFFAGELPEGYWVENGELVVGMDGDFNSRIWRGGRSLLNQRVCKLTPDDDFLDLGYLARLLPGYLDLINRHTSSVTVKHLSSRTLQATPIPLPPLGEQKRIVEKLVQLSARTRSAREHLDKVQTLATRAKNATLAAAFQGEWKVKPLSVLASVGTGATPKKGTPRFYEGGNIPWVTSGVANQDIVTEAEQYISDAAISETNCKIYPAGTILVAMYGEGKTRGMVTRLGIDAATNQALAAIQITALDLVHQEWVPWLLQSKYLEMREMAAGGVQPNLNLGIIKAIDVPLPSLKEQVEVIRSIEAAFARIDKMIFDASRAAELLERLEQQLLAKAFRGELVPQNPDDEPASVLLERIKAENAKAQKAKRSRKTKA